MFLSPSTDEKRAAQRGMCSAPDLVAWKWEGRYDFQRSSYNVYVPKHCTLLPLGSVIVTLLSNRSLQDTCDPSEHRVLLT